MGLHVDLLMGPQKAGMEITQRQLQVVILLHPAHDRQRRHAVAYQGIGHGVSHFPGIPPAGRYAWNRCLEILATGTSGLVDPNIGDNPGATVESPNVSNTSRDHVLAFAFFTTLRTGVLFGLDRLVLHLIGLAADDRGVAHRGSSRWLARYHAYRKEPFLLQF